MNEITSSNYFIETLKTKYNYDFLNSKVGAIYKNDHLLNHLSREILHQYIKEFQTLNHELQEYLAYIYITYQQYSLLEELAPKSLDLYLAYSLFTFMPPTFIEIEKKEASINRIYLDRDKIMNASENKEFIQKCFNIVFEDKKGKRLGSLGKGGSRGVMSKK